MRTPKMISPSAFARFEKDRTDYYLTYMAEPRVGRYEQSRPAAVGSAFDAVVKSALMNHFFGDRLRTTFEKMFEEQVEAQHRDFAYGAGWYVFHSYKESGALGDLIEMIEGAREAPQFEFPANIILGGVPISGKPDCRFVHRDGAHVILDWKVNGFCGKSASSPSKGYQLVRDGLGWDKPSRSHNKAHALYEPAEFKGLTLNKFNMEHVSIDWADQCTMYGWMMGEEPGTEDLVVCIDQVVSKPVGTQYPLLRFAQHRTRVSSEYQLTLVRRLNTMWEAIISGHVFCEETRAVSDQKMADLDRRALSMQSDGTPEGDFFAKAAKATTFYRPR